MMSLMTSLLVAAGIQFYRWAVASSHANGKYGNNWSEFQWFIQFYAGYYGLTCSKRCPNQCVSGQCNRMFGYCHCPAGFFGPKCNQPCPAGTWGPNCVERCHCNDMQTAICDTKVGYIDVTWRAISPREKSYLPRVMDRCLIDWLIDWLHLLTA